ncbi:MAG: patatin family protein [Candidatus Margulisbacteria bacterium]|jgi:predicted patatin/cPLA2 family phospholipase|nr:patatin family protein [Candidatus Margulisiibacteriota bacterium]
MQPLINANLVLEGGALRGMFTAGVLDALDEKDLLFEYIIGVSAGACMAVSYVTRQRGRNREILQRFGRDHRYFSIRNILREGNLFSASFVYEEIPQKLIPFDYRTFEESPVRFTAVATDCATGQAIYLNNKKEMTPAIRASASMPFVSKPVPLNGQLLLDGGIADSIPIEHARREGHAKSVVVLTRPKGYLKKPVGNVALFKRVLKSYPALAEAMYNRAAMYNRELAVLEELEAAGQSLIVYPPPEIKVGRLERNWQKLDTLYQAGRQAGQELAQKLPGFLAQVSGC